MQASIIVDASEIDAPLFSIADVSYAIVAALLLPLVGVSANSGDSGETLLQALEARFEAILEANLHIMTSMLAEAASFSQSLCAWCNTLAADADVEDMFYVATSWASQDDPNLAASPPGPFCAVCLV